MQTKGIPTWDVETNTMRYADSPEYYETWADWFKEGDRRIEIDTRVRRWRKDKRDKRHDD